MLYSSFNYTDITNCLNYSCCSNLLKIQEQWQEYLGLGENMTNVCINALQHTQRAKRPIIGACKYLAVANSQAGIFIVSPGNPGSSRDPGNKRQQIITFQSTEEG